MKGEPFLDTLGCGTWALGARSGAPGDSEVQWAALLKLPGAWESPGGLYNTRTPRPHPESL